MRVVTILAILSITVTAIYVLQTANRMLHGQITQPAFESLQDANVKEKITIIILVLSLLSIGLFPNGFSEWIDSSISPIYPHLMR